METEMGMKIKYNRISSTSQSGNRYQLDETKYDLVLFDKISGSVPFKERPKAKELVELVESGEVSELYTEEYSRLGRNTGDCLRVLEWLEEHEVNVVVRNLGLQSRPGGKRNPIWKMISSVMSSLYELELENIRDRTASGRKVYVQNGGLLGRPLGSNESEKQFLAKEKTQQILKLLNKSRTVREIAAITKCSSKTIQKAKETGRKYGYISCS